MINANDDVVSSNVVIEIPVQALWIIPAKTKRSAALLSLLVETN